MKRVVAVPIAAFAFATCAGVSCVLSFLSAAASMMSFAFLRSPDAQALLIFSISASASAFSLPQPAKAIAISTALEFVSIRVRFMGLGRPLTGSGAKLQATTICQVG